MNRRKFLSWVGVGGIATYLPIAIAACSPQKDNTITSETSTPNPNQPPELDEITSTDGFVEIGTVADLEAEGQIVQKVNDVIVFRDPNTSELVALSSLCPHKGCVVKWDKDEQNLACPCHDSFFEINGSVIKGPANQPLDVYQVKEEGGTILVKLT